MLMSCSCFFKGVTALFASQRISELPNNTWVDKPWHPVANAEALLQSESYVPVHSRLTTDGELSNKNARAVTESAKNEAGPEVQPEEEETRHIRLSEYQEGIYKLTSAYQTVIKNYSNIELASLRYRLSVGPLFSELQRTDNFQTKPVCSNLSPLIHANSYSSCYPSNSHAAPGLSTLLPDQNSPVISYKLPPEMVGPQKSVLNHFAGKSVSEVLVSQSFTSTHPIRLSQKVFLGGVPMCDQMVTEATCDELYRGLSLFGPVSLIWPKGTVIQSRLNSALLYTNRSEVRRGKFPSHCYATFRDPMSVVLLLSACQRRNKGCYINLSSLCPDLRSTHLDSIQVIPWDRTDTEYHAALVLSAGCNRLKDSDNISDGLVRPRRKQYSVFVGALHGMLTARALYTICNDLFGNVDSVVLDTDRYHYPIGSGRVAFTSPQSYLKAVNTNFVYVECQFFKKTIQIDPYLEDALCCKCGTTPGVYFCRDLKCFDYFCPLCWIGSHPAQTTHKPIRRSLNQRPAIV
ncbi:cytoplasmic polyadenylation element-binding protein [Paragonimus westermani]|uniref:Cytoplasmic polyadenylation element-binding protein n=1 Tax=Paragonimus westermani TaxID=34504 RepID=A0A5J4NWM4_9TREM|nr:cytoplasmic polyadenylation element-binding protein [Paragonimus westermani]